jgi:SAM-dependent methyltransferase
MDATPAMLLAIARKKEGITPFFGIAENIAGSIRKAREYATIPDQFDAVFSTLMLHHCTDIDKVFKSVQQVLKPAGKAVIIDMCTHSFTEFKDEMGDVHLGFDPEQIEKSAKKAFSKVTVEKLPGICCSSSGRCAELFVATLRV